MKCFTEPYQVLFGALFWLVGMGAVLQKLGFGGDEGGGDAAVKRQAEGLSNPMYQLANLMGQVLMFLQSTVPLIKTRQFDQNQATNKTHSIDLAFVSINLIKLYFDILHRP